MKPEEHDQNEDDLQAWAAKATLMLSRACEIVIEDSPQRLKEIAGFRGIIESCPVDAETMPIKEDAKP